MNNLELTELEIETILSITDRLGYDWDGDIMSIFVSRKEQKAVVVNNLM